MGRTCSCCDLASSIIRLLSASYASNSCTVGASVCPIACKLHTHVTKPNNYCDAHTYTHPHP